MVSVDFLMVVSMVVAAWLASMCGSCPLDDCGWLPAVLAVVPPALFVYPPT